MDNQLDFGFSSEEFLGDLTTVPYCQFLNAGSQKFGLAVTSSNAELAEGRVNRKLADCRTRI